MMNRWKQGLVSYNSDLVQDIIQYGENSFTHDILCFAETQADASVLEKFFIDVYDAMNPAKGYNKKLNMSKKLRSTKLTNGEFYSQIEILAVALYVRYVMSVKQLCKIFGATKYSLEKILHKHNVMRKSGNGIKGKPLTEQHKQRLSISLSGRKLSEEHKQKNSKPRSEATKKKLSILNRGENNPMFGKKHSQDTKKLMSEKQSGENNAMYGKSQSQERKLKTSLANSGENHPMFGKHLPDETKAKLSAARKGSTWSVINGRRVFSGISKSKK